MQCSRSFIYAFLALIPAAASLAEQNAALRRYGARIEVTCDHPKPLNTRWNKPEDMLRDQKPVGPLVNALASARITVLFPVPLTVMHVGLKQGDYRDSFAMAKGIVVQAPDGPEVRHTLSQVTDTPQFIDYAAKTDRIEIRVESIHPPKSGDAPADRPYGRIDQVQVIVAENLDDLFALPARYKPGQPTFVMRTPNLDPQAAPKVRGTPRKATEHPFTIWDAEDIREMKSQIDREPRARDAFDRIVAFCEKACANPLAVPDEPDLGTNPEVANRHQAVALAIGNLGIGYALSGNESYAAEAKRLLLELAKRYEGWPEHRHPKFSHDSSKWSWQRLNDAIWLIPAAWGFDLIWNSPRLSDEDRSTIAEHFVMPCVRNIMRSEGVITAPTNWSAVCCAAVMVGARVCGDAEYYEKSWMGLNRNLDDKRGGFFFHIDKGIDDDGMWAEGTLGYQFMAIRGLLVMAETLWHDGIDGYGYRDGRLKLVFDSPIWFCYPGGRRSPAVHDGGGGGLFGRDSHLYQYAQRRYGDATYNAILADVAPSLETVYNLFLPACDFGPVDAANLPEVPSILFPGVGFATIRTGEPGAEKYLMLDYGPNRSHGHPDKLNFCFYALGQELFADAGSAWYTTDVYKRYYSHSLAHNTVTANEMSQIMTGGRLEVYGSADDMGIVRASCDSAIPSVALDRTQVLSDGRLYDIYLVLSGIPFTFDLPYHCPGEFSHDLDMAPWTDWPKEARGYAYLGDPQAAKVDGDWACEWRVPRGIVRLHALGEPGTEVVFAGTPKGADTLPTAMIRRKGASTLYAAAVDVIPENGKASIASLKRLQAGDNAAGLEAELSDGGREIVLVNFTGEKVTVGDWQTDARVAVVRTNDGVAKRLYIAGGKVLRGPGLTVAADTPAMVAYYEVKDGLAVLRNQTEGPCNLELQGIAAADTVFALTRNGQRQAGGAPVRAKGGVMQVAVAAESSVELARGQQPTAADFSATRRRGRREAVLEQERQERARSEGEMKKQYARARQAAVPTGWFTLLQAEDFVAQGGGEVRITDNKAATYGTAFLHWDNRGHWVEYDFDVPKKGSYRIVLKYCREGSSTLRGLSIDGNFPCEAARKMAMPGTGGWSNGADNWQYYTLQWPQLDVPYLVELDAGSHRLRLENVAGDSGLNLDYVVVAAPFLDVTRELVEK